MKDLAEKLAEWRKKWAVYENDRLCMERNPRLSWMRCDKAKGHDGYHAAQEWIEAHRDDA